MKKLLLVMLSSLVLILTGCGTAHLEVESDGSGRITYNIPLEETFYTFEELKSEITDTVVDANSNTKFENVKLKSIKEKDGVAVVVIDVKDLGAANNSEILVAPLKDVSRLQTDELLEAVNKDGEQITLEDIEKNGDKIALFMNVDSMLTETKITLPGKVLYASEGATIDGKTITSTDSEIIVIYEEGGSNLLLTLIVFLVIVAGGFFGFKVFKNKKQGPAATKPSSIEPTKLVGGNDNV